MTTIPTDKLEAMLAGAKLATPGPWLYPTIFGSQVLTGDSWNTICVLYEGPRKAAYDHRMAAWEDGRCAADQQANSKHIAACDPDTITSLITELIASRSTNEDLRRERDAARAALSADGMEALALAIERGQFKLRAEAAERELAIVKEGGWRDMVTCPKNGTIVRLLWGPPEDPTSAEAFWRGASFVAAPVFYDPGVRHPHHVFREFVVTSPVAWMPLAPLPPPPTLQGKQE